MTELLDRLLMALRAEEGWEAQAYVDSRGYLTIGYGFNLGKITGTFVPIGSIPPVIGEALLLGKVMSTLTTVRDVFPAFDTLDVVRQEVLADMAYNLGPEFLTPGHEKSWPVFMGQVERGDFVDAARNMRSTEWYGEVGKRSPRLVEMMRTGMYSPARKKGQ
jgi:lysozyme